MLIQAAKLGTIETHRLADVIAETISDRGINPGYDHQRGRTLSEEDAVWLAGEVAEAIKLELAPGGALDVAPRPLDFNAVADSVGDAA